MLVVIASVVIAWLLVRETGTEKIVILLSIGLITSYIIAVLASLPPITEISLSENEDLRVFSPVAYPFCIQQYRNYAAQLFSYAVTLGWPEGTPLLQLALQDDQSEFIHVQHYLSGLGLGMLLLLGMAILVGTLAVLDRMNIRMRRQRTPSVFLIIPPQLILLILVVSQSLVGSIVYTLGGVIVLLITLYPTLQAVRSRNLEKLDTGLK
ncbi:MAG: hypothetical protein EAX95_01410 [Candidatus Thorarchaeota archaeon]|nr:hypothetical protein [Candidatus Thorarchaeota archaeon]